MTHAVKSQSVLILEGKILTADDRILLAIKPKCMKNLHMWRKGVKMTFPTPPMNLKMNRLQFIHEQ